MPSVWRDDPGVAALTIAAFRPGLPQATGRVRVTIRVAQGRLRDPPALRRLRACVCNACRLFG